MKGDRCMPSNRDMILDEVRAERGRQIAMGCDRDDAHNTANDFVAYIADYVGRAVVMYRNEREGYGFPKFREMMVKVAALALAAIEWHDAKGRRNAE